MRTHLALNYLKFPLVAVFCALCLAQMRMAVAAPDLSLQGRVVAALPQPGRLALSTARAVLVNVPQPTSLSRPILMPDIEVWLRNAGTKAESSHVTTNPQGYFAIHGLGEGRYQVCGNGKGFAGRCENRIVSVTRPAQI